MTENEVGTRIINSAFLVHRELGPGLLESAYQKCLCYLLEEDGLKIKSQMPVPLKFKEVYLDSGYKLDLLVEDKVIIELKAVEEINDLFLAQLLTYMKLTGCKLGYLINFNTKFLKDGIKRLVLGL